MIEVLPIRLLTDTDSPIFGQLNVALGKLERSGIPVSRGIVVTSPELKLKTVLEHFDFGHKEIFEQSLTLVRKEISSLPIPDNLDREISKEKHFFVNGQLINSARKLWQTLLEIWISQIKERLWKDGFYKGLTEALDPQIVIFFHKIESFGSAHFDLIQDDVVISIKHAKLHPNDLHNLQEIVKKANKKLLIPHQYDWILDKGIKLVKVLPYTPEGFEQVLPQAIIKNEKTSRELKSSVKVFFDLSEGLTIENNIEGIYIASEKIFDLNKPKESFENLAFKLVESSVTFPDCPILFKLADKSEGMGKIRGSLRLLHQKNLFEPLLDILIFVRHKKGLNNIHIVIPFVRNAKELMQIKRELAVKKLMRKASLKQWLEIAVPENIINLEDYLALGIDGVVLNLDELISHLNGFDIQEGELVAYKNEVSGLLKFLEDGLKLLHKTKIPFIAYGSLSLYPEVLEFLVGKGVYGVVTQRYEAHSAKDLLHLAEKRVISRKME